MERADLTFPSGDASCSAWLYRPAAAGPEPAACVVMAHGFSLTRHDGLAPYAEALAHAGAAVLVFDPRFLGDSGGWPRQRFRIAAQEEDYHSAVAFARSLDGIDPDRILVWGFSFSGGIALKAAAADRRIAGAILLCPFLDGVPRVLAAVRQSPSGVAWILARAVKDRAGRHNVIPVTAQPGEHAAMTFPGEADGFAAARGADSPWRNEISPGIFLTVALHRPGRLGRHVACPVWVGIGERDISVHNPAIERFAQRAPRAELHHYDVDHFEPFYGPDPERISADQADWLRRAIA